MSVNGSGGEALHIIHASMCGALRPQAGDPAGEHVAGAGSGQRGVAGRVHERQQAGRSYHGARALEHHYRTEPIGQRLRCLQAIGLHAGCVTVQQACRFERVRRQHRGALAVRACAQQVLQHRICCDGVQCVGVEHQA